MNRNKISDSYCPKNEKCMADLKESLMAEITNPKYLRCVDSAGNSKLLLYSYLLSALVSSKGGIDENNIDITFDSGIYYHGVSIGNLSYGVLVVFSTIVYTLQVNFGQNGVVSYRLSFSKGSWDNWKHCQFT